MTDTGHDIQSGSEDGAPPEAFEKAADLLRALSHPVRLKMIELLGGGELCVKSLEEILGISQSSVSQHLTRLRYAGLIESERRGHLVCYRLVKGGAARILEAAMDESQPKDREERGLR
ncbi:MAG: metalloregulator ArsR/SmtB family transcription factor [Candidatus Eisenbacteria bacterium]